jgi:hypothetical protein
MNKDNYIALLQSKILEELQKLQEANERGHSTMEFISGVKIELLHELIAEISTATISA